MSVSGRPIILAFRQTGGGAAIYDHSLRGRGHGEGMMAAGRMGEEEAESGRETGICRGGVKAQRGKERSRGGPWI